MPTMPGVSRTDKRTETSPCSRKAISEGRGGVRWRAFACRVVGRPSPSVRGRGSGPWSSSGPCGYTGVSRAADGHVGRCVEVHRGRYTTNVCIFIVTHACHGMSRYIKGSQGMSRYVKVCQAMLRYVKICRGVLRHI